MSPKPTVEQLYEEALKGGYVNCRIALCILIGAAGGGKTQAKQLLLNEEPLQKRDSTDLSEPPVRAVSLDRATIDKSDISTFWKVVTPDDFHAMVLGSIKSRSYCSNPPSTITTSTLPPFTITTSALQPKASVTTSDSTPSPPSATAPGTPVSERPPEYDHEEALTTVEKKFIEDLELASRDQVLKMDWVYLLDTGGQPQFQEILPAFIKRALAVFFVTKLNEKFSECPTAEYWKKGKLIGEQSSSISNKQFLKRYFRVMQSRCSKTGQGPFVFFIGTHKDRIDPEHLAKTRKDKNSELLDMLGDHFQDKLRYYDLYSDELIYPVDATSRHMDDVEVASKIRGDLQEVFKKIEYERIPLTWFLFEHFLQKLAAVKNLKVLSIEECKRIGDTKLHMSHEQCHAALQHLTGLNILFYDPECGVVFVNSQVLVSMVSKLVCISYALNGDGHNDFFKELGLSAGTWRTFGMYGLLTVDLLNELKGHYRDKVFTPKDFLDLLKRLQLVAPFEEDTPSSQAAKFIMPCVLPELHKCKIQQHRPKSPPVPPLLIYYPDMQLLPAGIFIILTACLQNKCGWKIRRTKSKPEMLSRNCVKFDMPECIDCRGSVTLIDSFAGYLEIHVESPSQKIRERETTCRKACPVIVQHIYKGLSDAAGVLGYGDLKHKLAFFCDGGGGPDCKEELHLAEIIGKDWQCRDCPDWGNSLREEHKFWLMGE